MSSNQMLLAALLASAGLGGVGLSSSGSAPVISVGKQGRRKQSKRRLVSSGYGGMNPTNSADLTIKPPSMNNVPSRVPRNVAARLAWDTVKVETQIVGTGAITETNYSATLQSHPQSGQWQALFDQWSIPQITVEFDSLVPPGASFIPATLHTALDFDSSGALGSIQGLEDYSTAEYMVMNAGARHMRSIRPSAKTALQNSGGSLNQGGVTGPVWVDSAASATSFGNIRSILSVSPYTTVNVTMTIWYCFRNQI